MSDTRTGVHRQSDSIDLVRREFTENDRPITLDVHIKEQINQPGTVWQGNQQIGQRDTHRLTRSLLLLFDDRLARGVLWGQEYFGRQCWWCMSIDSVSIGVVSKLSTSWGHSHPNRSARRGQRHCLFITVSWRGQVLFVRAILVTIEWHYGLWRCRCTCHPIHSSARSTTLGDNGNPTPVQNSPIAHSPSRIVEVFSATSIRVLFVTSLVECSVSSHFSWFMEFSSAFYSEHLSKRVSV